MRPGRFVTLEGPEGCGKTTQIRLLADALAARGIEVVTLREPGGTPVGEALRGILQHDTSGGSVAPETELLLFEASRAQLVREVIRPALEAGTWVLCDRFADSTTAYQGHGRGFDVDRVQAINAFATGNLVPDLTVLLDMDLDASLDRMRRRNEDAGIGADRFEREARAFHERVRDGYLAIARQCAERISIVDATQGIDVIAGEIRQLIEPWLPGDHGAEA